MARTRTGLLSSGLLTTSGFHTVLTGPTGHSTIVKEQQFYNGAGATVVISVWQSYAAGQWTVAAKHSLNATSGLRVSSWTVVPAGWVWFIELPGAGSLTYWLSGTFLEPAQSIEPQRGTFVAEELNPLPAIAAAG